jgi:hypothetical protein
MGAEALKPSQLAKMIAGGVEIEKMQQGVSCQWQLYIVV